MNLEDILECLNDGYENDSYGRTMVSVSLAQQLILEAARLHKPRWINSEERLPELSTIIGLYRYSNDVLIYDGVDCKVSCLRFIASNGIDSGYKWVIEDYTIPIEGTCWMPLPKTPISK